MYRMATRVDPAVCYKNVRDEKLKTMTSLQPLIREREEEMSGSTVREREKNIT
jgi:hypothetical protein